MFDRGVEGGGEQLIFCSTEAWKAVVDKLQDARANARMKQLSHSSVNGLTMFGLSHSAITFLTEQLFGARHCRNYNHKYHAYERDEFDEVRTTNCSLPMRVQ